MIKKIFSHALGAAFLALAFAFVPAPRSAAATAPHGVEVTFPGAAGLSGSLTNFPVAVRFGNDSPQGFSYETCANPTGICFYADAYCTVELPCEIEWNPQGESVAWVKIPKFNKDTKIYMAWMSNGGVFTRTTQPKDVWSGYLGVWHMNDEPGKVVADSAMQVENMDGTTTEAFTFAPTNGKIGGATKTASVSDQITVRDFASDIANKKFSVSGWFYWPGATHTDYQTLYNKGNWQNPSAGSYIEIYPQNNGYTKLEVVLPQKQSGFVDLLNDVRSYWNYFAYVCDGSNTRLYINGSSKTIDLNDSTKDPTGPGWTMRLQFRGGWRDETRVYNGLLSADQVAQEYAMQNAPGYTSFKEPQDGYFLPLGKTLPWNGNEQTGIPERDYYTVVGGTAKATARGTYTATVRLTDPGTMKWSGLGTSDDQTITWSIVMAENAWERDARISAKNYARSAPAVLVPPVPKVGTVKAYLDGVEWPEGATSTVAPTHVAAGTHRLVYKVAASDNWSNAIETTPLTFTIVDDSKAWVSRMNYARESELKWMDNGDLMLVFTNTEDLATVRLDGRARAQLLVVGGGGAGGPMFGGGGGGGGVIYHEDIELEPGIYSVKVGKGGKGLALRPGEDDGYYGAGANGEDSYFSTPVNPFVAYGGGGGGGAASRISNKWRASGAGGSSGGGTQGREAAKAKDLAQGNNGGNGSAGNYAGGGGGAAGAGTNGSAEAAGDGGAGRMISIDGKNVYYGAGGGASRAGGNNGTVKVAASGGAGGAGGGGAGATKNAASGSTDPDAYGKPGTGWGAGGGGSGVDDNISSITYEKNAPGYQGIVILRIKSIVEVDNIPKWMDMVRVLGGQVGYTREGSALVCFREPNIANMNIEFDDFAYVEEMLIVGGGGGGGACGGGGGAGGAILNNDIIIEKGFHAVAVGLGGEGSSAGNSGGAVNGKSGGDSWVGEIRALGGGYGGGMGNKGGNGGSGGGGGANGSPDKGLGCEGQGHDGDHGYPSPGGANGQYGGGGGGAAAPGNGRNGGAGIQSSISGVASWYAGGGGSGFQPSYGSGGQGGSGVGGNGGSSYGNGGSAAKENTGSGGGGGGGQPGNGWIRYGGKGANGIIYLKIANIGGMHPRYPAWKGLVSVERSSGFTYDKNKQMIVTFADTTADGALKICGDATVDLLVVGGGGGGGTWRKIWTGQQQVPDGGGGGGGGGIVFRESQQFSQRAPYDTTTLDVHVGAGGGAGATGQNSTVTVQGIAYVGYGGGGGATGNNEVGKNGGSGGGGAYGAQGGYSTQQNAGEQSSGYGNPGGGMGHTTIGGGGGGGGSEPGGASTADDVSGDPAYGIPAGRECKGVAGAGGKGWPSAISGEVVYYGGGGGGGGDSGEDKDFSDKRVVAGGLGGLGGGGNGSFSGGGAAGAANTGGGGGGGGYNNGNGGAGGSGIVILRVRNVTPQDLPVKGLAIGPLVYTGEELQGVEQHPEFYTVENGFGTTAGVYSATLTLVNDINKWANLNQGVRSVKVEWRIEKARNSVETPYSMSWREGTTPGVPEAKADFGRPRFIWAADRQDGEDLEWRDWDETVEDGRPSAVGTYRLKAIVDEDANWLGAESEEGVVEVVAKDTSFARALAYRSDMKVDYDGEPLENFVLEVRVSEDNPFGFHYRDAAANGADIRFVNGSNEVYPCEVASWNENGESRICVLLPRMEKDQTLTMCWGKVAGETLTPNNPSSVWGDYAGVWHFNERIAAEDAAETASADATGGGHDAMPAGAGDMKEMVSAEGMVGGARVNALLDVSGGNRLLVADGEGMALGGDFTFTGYFRNEDFASAKSPVLVSSKTATGGDGWEISLDRAAKEVVVSGAGSTSVKALFDLTTATPQPAAKTLLKSSARAVSNSAPLLGATASQDGDIELGMDGLPFGYTRLEWIQSTREQVIVTDYLPNPKTVLKLDLKMSGTFKNTNAKEKFPVTSIPGSSDTFSCTASIFGCNDSTVAQFSMNYGGNQEQNNHLFPWTNIGYQDGKGEAGHESDIGDEHKSKNLMTIDPTAGTKKLTWGSKSFTINEKQTTHKTHPLALFGQTGYTQYCQARPFGCYEMTLYSAQILEDGELKADFIPCRSESGEVGLYDRVAGKFYGNYLSEPDALFDGAKGIAWAESKFVAGPELVELDYVQSTGYEYVDLGVKPGKDTRVVIRYSPSGPNSSWFLAFGANGNAASLLLYKRTDGLQILQHDSYVDANQNSFIGKGATQGVEYTLDVSNAKWVLNGETLAENKGGLTKTCAGSAYLFAMHAGWVAAPGVYDSAGTWAQMKVMRCQFYEGATLTHDFKPVKYIDGSTEKVGLWDAVELKLLTSATAQPLQAGPERIFATPDKVLDRATVVLDAAVFEYDGTSHTPRITVATNGVMVVKEKTAAEINAGDYGFTASWSPAGTTDPGTYYLILKGDNERFYGTNSKKSFEIHIDPSRRLENATVTLEKPSATYDGLAHDPLITVTTGGVAVASALTAAEINTRHLGFTASWSPSEIKAPGAYTLTLTGDKVAFTGTSAPVRFLIASYHRLDVTFDASAGDGKAAVTIYVDGEQKGSGQITVTGAGSALAFGGREGAVSFGGDLDEFMLRRGVASGDLIALNAYQQTEKPYVAEQAKRVIADKTLENRWLDEPSLSKTSWLVGEAPAECLLGKAAYGDAVVRYRNCANNTFSEEMPTVSGVWEAVFSAAKEGWTTVETRIPFRIDSIPQKVTSLGIGRTLLFNDAPEHSPEPISGQGYAQLDPTICHWRHDETSTSFVSDDYNFLGGTRHEYCSPTGEILWDLVNVRFGNTFPKDPQAKLTEFADRNFLPWDKASSRMVGSGSVGDDFRWAGQAVMQNTIASAIVSGCFTNGIGTVYFDAVNAFTAAKQLGGLDLALEVATRLKAFDLPPTDANLTNGVGEIDYDQLDWQPVAMSPVKVCGETMTPLAPTETFQPGMFSGKAASFPEPGVIEWTPRLHRGVAALDFPKEGTLEFAYSIKGGTLNGIPLATQLSGDRVALSSTPSSTHGSYGGSEVNQISDSAYKDVLNNGIWGNAGTITVTLKGLKPARRYLVQVFAHDNRNNYGGRKYRMDESIWANYGYNSSLSSGTANGSAFGTSFVGRFEATAESIAFTMTADQSLQLNFVQLRDITDVLQPGVDDENSHAVEYLETQSETVLDTGFVPDSKGWIELGYEPLGRFGDNATFICVRRGIGDGKYMAFFNLKDASVRYDWNATQTSATNIPKYDELHHFRFDATGAYDGDQRIVENPTGNRTEFETAGTLHLFASCDLTASGMGYGNYSKGRLYYVRAYDAAGELIFDGRPWVHDGEACLYDAVGCRLIYPSAKLKASENAAPFEKGGFGGSATNFYRVAATVNTTKPARFRLRRATMVGEPSSENIDSWSILVDNVIVSEPVDVVNLTTRGHYNPALEGKQTLGWANAFSVPFPGVSSKIHARAKPVGDFDPGLVDGAVMHYRWRYLDQQYGEWQRVYLDAQDGFTAGDPLSVPRLAGDVEYWFEVFQHAPVYDYVDYSGTDLKLPGSVAGGMLSVTNGLDEGWFVRLREGECDYENLRVAVRNQYDGDNWQYFDMEVVGDHVWRGYVPMTDALGYDGDTLHYRIVACNGQTAGSTDWVISTNYWCQAEAVNEKVPVMSSLRLASEMEYATLPMDRQTGYLAVQVDDRSLAVSVVKADYQNFNLWTDAKAGDDLFVGSAVENESKKGCSPLTKVVSCDFSMFEETSPDYLPGWTVEATPTPPWQENFVDNAVGGAGEEERSSFRTLNNWFSGGGRYVYGTYRSPLSNRALEMWGRGLGSLEYLCGQVAEVDPRGIESLSFSARLGQNVGFEDFVYDASQERKTWSNYTFTALVAFDRSQSTAFSGNATLSLVAYYRPNKGCYELSWDQSESGRKGCRLSLYRWSRSGTTIVREKLTNLMACQRENFNATLTSESRYSLYQPLFMSVHTEKNRTVIRCGVKRAGMSINYDDQTMFRPDNKDWDCLMYYDLTDKRLQSGTYGVLSADCGGVFTRLRAGKLNPGEDYNSFGALELDGVGIPNSGHSQPLGERFSTYRFAGTADLSKFSECDEISDYDKDWVRTNPGRMAPFNRSELAPSGYRATGFEAKPIRQELLVYSRPAGASGWGEPVEVKPVENFGTAGNTREYETKFWHCENQDVRIALAGEEDDYDFRVVIDNVRYKQWRGVNFMDQSDWYDYANGYVGTGDNFEKGGVTNFTFQSVWFTGGAAKLSARRTLPGTASGIRTPLVDGKRLSGFGMLGFDYENAQANVNLLVQIATNAVATNLAEVSELNLRELEAVDDPRWVTVTNFDFSVGALSRQRGKGTLCVYPGLHGATGVMRVIVDPKLVEQVQSSRNQEAFGEIDILKVYLVDEPELDEKSWWGWNLQTTDRADRSMLTDRDGERALGLSLGLNNSVTEGLAESDPNVSVLYRENKPLVQSPSFGTNTIGDVMFRARKYALDPDGRDQNAQVTVYAHSTFDGQVVKLADVVIDSDRWEQYTVQVGRGYDWVRLAVTGVAGVKDAGMRPISGTQPTKVLIDEVLVSEGLVPRLGFQNVAAFRDRDTLQTRAALENPNDRVHQPLVREPWGVQCELVPTSMADEIDYTRMPRVKLHYFAGTEPWGYENWCTNPAARSAWLTAVEDASPSNLVYHSSYANPDSVIAPGEKEGDVYQYMLEVTYYRKNSDRAITELMGRDGWRTPSWYQPIDYNNGQDSFAAFMLTEDIAPGWAWINEVNIFGATADELYINLDDLCQYIEVAAPVEADLKGWTINLISFEGSAPKKNKIATFGVDAEGRKAKNEKSNMVFHLLASSHAGDKILNERDGTLDGRWTFTRRMDSDLGYDNNGNIDIWLSFGITLERPSGIVESAVTLVGRDVWSDIGEGGGTMYAQLAKKINNYYRLDKVIPIGADTNGVLTSLGVFSGNGESPLQWNNTMVKTPGMINANQEIDPIHPISNPDAFIVYSEVDQKGGPLRQRIGEDGEFAAESKTAFAQNGSEAGVTITYEVDPWYEMGPESVLVTITNRTTHAEVVPVAGRERTYQVTVGQGSSNNVRVVAVAQLEQRLREYGLDSGNRYTPAVVDWLREGKRDNGKSFENPGGELYLAEYENLVGEVITNLTLTQMYWLDIDPTKSGQVFRAGMSSSEMMTREIDGGRTGRYWRIGFEMMISNRYDRTAYAPYALRAVDPQSSSRNYGNRPGDANWSDVSFCVLGKPYEYPRYNWMALRWFVFHHDSFGEDFRSTVEFLDPHEPGSVGYSTWYELFNEDPSATITFGWDITPYRQQPFNVEILRPENPLFND